MSELVGGMRQMRWIFCCFLVLSVSAVFRPLEGSCTLRSEEMAAAKLLGLIPPIEVVYSGYYEDGGTIGFRFCGAGQKTLEVCLDGRMDYPSPRSIYVGAGYPSRQGARRLKIGSPEDQAVVLLLRVWLERLFPPPELEKLREAARTYRFDSTQQRDAGRILRWLDRRTAREALYQDEDACAHVFGLQVPVALVGVIVSDSSSNSVGFILRDSLGEELRGGIYRLTSKSPARIWVGGSAKPRGGLSCSLAIDSNEETAMLGLLSHWFEGIPPGASRKAVGGVDPALSALLLRWLIMYPAPDLPEHSELPTEQ